MTTEYFTDVARAASRLMDSVGAEKVQTPMDYKTACERAQADSRNGYVQHVNKVAPMLDDDPNTDIYIVSDWYDSHETVKSYENGKEK